MGPWKGTEQPGGREWDFIQSYNLCTIHFHLRTCKEKLGTAVLWGHTQTNYNGNYDQKISLRKDLIHNRIFI